MNIRYLWNVQKLVLLRLTTLNIKSLILLPASLYCKVRLYTTMKWKTMDFKCFGIWNDCLSNFVTTLGKYVEYVVVLEVTQIP